MLFSDDYFKLLEGPMNAYCYKFDGDIALVIALLLKWKITHLLFILVSNIRIFDTF